MNATREKKLKFIRSFGQHALQDAVVSMLCRKEAPWLTDEQIDDITEQMASDARFANRNAVRNREITKRALAYTDAGRPEPLVYSALEERA